MSILLLESTCTLQIISVDNFFDKPTFQKEFYGLMQEESSKLLKDFFLERR